MADDIMGAEVYAPQLSGIRSKETSRLLNIMFVVDVSESMKIDGRMAAVNEAFVQMVSVLRQFQMDYTELELKIAIMTFDQYAQWIVAPTPILEHNHNEIVCSPYAANYTVAFKSLGEKLTRTEYMAHTGKIARPHIIFMTANVPASDDNFQPALDSLLKNGWFKVSQRTAVLIGAQANNCTKAGDALAQFVSNPDEDIVYAANADAIVAEIKIYPPVTLGPKRGVPTHASDSNLSRNTHFEDNDILGDNNDDAMGSDFSVFGDGSFDDSSFI